MSIPEQFQILFDNQPFEGQKMTVLDQLTQAFSQGNMENVNNYKQINIAQKIWEMLKEDNNFWTHTDQILLNSQQTMTKFNTLLVMEIQVKKQWRAISQQQRTNIREFLIQLVLNLGAQSNSDKNILLKINTIIILIIKEEWFNSWKSCIQEICNAARQNENLCNNNLVLLKMLSEEIFDFSKNSITSKQVANLKSQMTDEFQHIYNLCFFITSQYVQNQNSVKAEIITKTLNCLQAFLTWIPLGYIFFTELIDILLYFVDTHQFRTISIKCLNEIVTLKPNNEDFKEEDQKKMSEKIIVLYVKFIQKLQNFVPIELDLSNERSMIIKQGQYNSQHDFDTLCMALSMFFTCFFNVHISWIEKMIKSQNQEFQLDLNQLIDFIKKGMQYIINFTNLPEENIYKVCCEFWQSFSCNLLSETQSDNLYNLPQQQSILRLDQNNSMQIRSLQKHIYPDILDQLKAIVILRMAKPQEVLIRIENGLPVQEVMVDTENNSLYELLKSLIVNLSKLNWQTMKSSLTNQINKQLDEWEFTFDKINSLCWAVGSISGTLPEQDEKSFVINTIRSLLNLCDIKKGKENKAVIAANIMYVVGAYPNFLKANWNFLKTVVKKLFEFMKETFEGVMQMAVNTFVTISESCKEEFVIIHKDGNVVQEEPYIHNLIRTITQETQRLPNELQLTFFQAIGNLISADQNINVQEQMLQNALKQVSQQYTDIMGLVAQGKNQILLDPNCIEQILFFLQKNERLAATTGFSYIRILNNAQNQLLQLYQFYSQSVSEQIAQNPQFLQYSSIKNQRNIKIAIIQIYTSFFKKCDKKNNNFSAQQIQQNILPGLDYILEDYSARINDLKEYQVLNLYEQLFANLPQCIYTMVPNIISKIFQSTLQMITVNFTSYPDHRNSFFQLLRAVVSTSFESLYKIPNSQFQFQTLIDCVI